jgi:hypothetical protein
MKPVTTIALRRNTAIKSEALVESTTLSMIREEIPEGAMLWSFDPTVPANEELVYCVDGEGTREWTQHVEHGFGLVNWAAKKVLIPNETTGDLTAAIRVTLIDKDRETLCFVSTGIAASLDLLRTFRGDGPYEPPIFVVFRQVKTRRGFATLKMRPAPTVEGGKTK